MTELPDFMDAHRPVLRGGRHMVVAGHYLAAQAAFKILEAGGNAVDAGVAGGIALSVVQCELVNFAGVAPIMIHMPGRDLITTIAGLGGWPKALDVDDFIARFDGQIPSGIMRTVVPSAPQSWLTALSRYGTMSFAEVAYDATSYARDGFIMYPLMAETIAEHQHQNADKPANAAIYLPKGRPPRVGELFKQEDLAGSLQYMADQETAAGGDRENGLQAARDAFYRGDIASQFVRFHEENGGLLAAEDLADFTVEELPPVSARLGDMDVYACGPWTQGPLIPQTLRLLENRDLASMGHNSPDYAHLMIEAFKLAAADRERYYTDPNFADVPMAALLGDDYSALRREMIDMAKASPGMPEAGDPRAMAAAAGGPQPEATPEPALALDTSYLCVIDGDGNVFSATPSDTPHDAAVVPGTGLCPSGRGSQAWADKNHPCCLAPGKRGRLTPNPAIAIKKGELTMPFGTPGGDVQCQSMLQVLCNIHVFGMNPQAAVEAPRFASFSFPESFAPHGYTPGRLQMEGRLGQELGDALAARGHQVKWWRQWDWKAGAVCTIVHDQKNGVLSSGADPRRPCYALGR